MMNIMELLFLITIIVIVMITGVERDYISDFDNNSGNFIFSEDCDYEDYSHYSFDGIIYHSDCSDNDVYFYDCWCYLLCSLDT